MAALRTFFKRTVGQHSSNNSNLTPRTNTDSSSDTSSSTTASERLNTRTNDGYNSASTLGILINNNHDDDTLRRPLLNLSSTNRRRRFFSCFMNNSTIMNTQEEQLLDENICLLDKKLPKELLLRIFSYLDYQSLCRCAQVSKVTQSQSFPAYSFSIFIVLEYIGIRWIQLAEYQSEKFPTRY
jgi:hypothetical protein